MKLHKQLYLLSAVLLSACSTADSIEDVFAVKLNELDARGKPLPMSHRSSQGFTTRSADGSVFAGATQYGTGSFLGAQPAISTGKTSKGAEGYSLNLVDAPINSAAKSVLGDTLGANYVVDPRVGGKVTLQTAAPVSKEVLLDIFEAALTVNGAVITKQNGSYQIVPASEAFSSTPEIATATSSLSGPGVKVQAIELKYVAAAEMKSILEPISRRGSILRVDDHRNIIVLAGTSNDLSAMRNAISIFDVDWMRGMSVVLHPLRASQSAAVAKELGSIFATESGPGSNIIRFIPNERLNAVLVITSRPAYLQRAAAWISKLDRLAATNEERLFVYNIQNRPAKELAQVLQSVLKGREAQESSQGLVDNPIAPDLQPATISSAFNPAQAEPASSDPSGLLSSSTGQPGKPKTSVVADVENNALLISTTAREYERIEPLLRQLDVVPTQVMLEAVIAEVTLNDELRFGLRWFFENGNFRVGFSDLASGGTGASFPALAWSYATNDMRVTLNALSSITDVNVVSAPTLMALNNQKAILQIGDQVPIVTRQSQSTNDSDASVINSVEMKDTGIILTVIPRINTSGKVMLDIQQEVSDVVRTTSSGIDSPTIQQRKVSTRVVVNDNESLALGGLIQQRNDLVRSQVPILGDIPLLGNAFKHKTDQIRKTELIIFIRPRIVRDVNEARSVTEEFRQQLDFSSDIKKRRGGSSKLEQDMKRLSY
ncbi:type II secretion system secretin GspD [Neorhizobium sp. DT-125]|uniref:type II secretion system secretin GspD n=1 Tax=Neorhizobium sp. DT-125 TaxID=3396163 RepID=UPI003F1ACD5A